MDLYQAMRHSPVSTKRGDLMKSLEASITVHVPASIAFEYWRDFENFPRFMEGVTAIEDLEGPFFRLLSENGGIHYESLCEIILEIPERRLAWRTITGAASMGVVRFEFQPGHTTLVSLSMTYDPEGGWQDHAQVAGRLRRNLEHFKKLTEESWNAEPNRETPRAIPG